MDALKSLFGMGPSLDYNELMAKGAQIIDVAHSGRNMWRTLKTKKYPTAITKR